MLIPHKGHTDTIQVYSVTVMTHVKALQAGHSSQGTSESYYTGMHNVSNHIAMFKQHSKYCFVFRFKIHFCTEIVRKRILSNISRCIDSIITDNSGTKYLSGICMCA